MSTPVRSTHVFINCPFDTGYQPIFTAIVFAVYELGFVARCSLEDDDAGEVRLTKIQRIIEECRYGINDLSTVTLDTVTGLPRFNMPLELGLFLGCKRFGVKNQSNKRTLILDSEGYRYRQFISDISGQDIRAHGADPEQAIRAVRDWLQATSKRQGLAGGGEIIRHYRRFQVDLPAICREAELEIGRLTFIDLSTVITDWLRANR
ncbi:MAG TPA: hypothetical protein VHW09_08135 [Bryobacteraceae bacterium]|nr:hypothetical protein [Bryobacteraceae bacterium]